MKKKKILIISLVSASFVTGTSIAAGVILGTRKTSRSYIEKFKEIKNLIENEILFNNSYFTKYKIASLSSINQILKNGDINESNEEKIKADLDNFYKTLKIAKELSIDINNDITQLKELINNISEENELFQESNNLLNAQIDFVIDSIKEFKLNLTNQINKVKDYISSDNNTNKLINDIKTLKEQMIQNINSNQFNRYAFINESFKENLVILTSNLEVKSLDKLKEIKKEVILYLNQYNEQITLIKNAFNLSLNKILKNKEYLSELKNENTNNSAILEKLNDIQDWIDQINLDAPNIDEIKQIDIEFHNKITKIANEIFNENNLTKFKQMIQSLEYISDEIKNSYIEKITVSEDLDLIFNQVETLNNKSKTMIDFLDELKNELVDINYLDSENKNTFDELFKKCLSYFNNKKLTNIEINFDEIKNQLIELKNNFNGNKRIKNIKNNITNYISNLNISNEINNKLNTIVNNLTRYNEFETFNEQIVKLDQNINKLIKRFNEVNETKNSDKYKNASSEKQEKFNSIFHTFSTILLNGKLIVFETFDTTNSQIDQTINKMLNIENTLEDTDEDILNNWKTELKQSVVSNGIFSNEMIKKIEFLIDSSTNNQELELFKSKLNNIQMLNAELLDILRNISTIKTTDKFNNATDESKQQFIQRESLKEVIYENERIKLFDSLDLVIDELTKLKNNLVNIETILIEKTEDNQNNNNELKNKIDELKVKLEQLSNQNYYVENFTNDLLEIETKKGTIEQLNNLDLLIQNFVNEVNDLPTNYKNLSLVHTIINLDKSSSSKYYLKPNQDIKIKIQVNYNNKLYDLKYLKTHNILISYRFGLASDRSKSFQTLDSSKIDWFNGIITLNSASFESELRLDVAYNQDEDNSVSTRSNNIIRFDKDDRVEKPIVTNTNSIGNYDFIKNSRLINKYGSSITDAQKVLDSNWNTQLGTTILDNKNISYSDAMWIMFLKLFNNANFINKPSYFNVDSEEFINVFDKNGSFSYRFNAIAKENLTNYKFTSLGGSFFDTVLNSSEYNNKFNLNKDDKISFIFTFNSNKQTPSILNNNQGDLSAVGSEYNIVGKYPFLANFEGTFNFKILINDSLKLNVNNTDRNQLQSVPIFVIRKTNDNEINFYTSSSKASIG
ncbi:hypothetical protein MALH04_00738 [Mycoplasma anatis]|uniref:hypothetical protein n=1 Tax=Mycoplasmopsis anatis TaxID=171279 RepID=UPI001C4E0396|nr:hypothetical protein [Mycoplasmopsis anatis]MBW0594964.1 hypothetical protein [Mycoplasmopsis anatis]MBW0598576.1 hypothetical protein [Mycoplasmopsis anatis]MBW0599341.1 hypothetical protein [Mycoplasmopsis anatis]MBW0601534.1 hypothetical protein [Mycoplasmopsis anatis]